MPNSFANFVAARWRSLAGLAGLGVIFLWAYWPTLGAMADKWSTDPQYSHGYLVPVFAGLLFWLRRGRIEAAALTAAPAGVALMGVGLALNLAAARYYSDWLDMVSLLPVLAGLCLCYGGRPALAWAWPSIAFLAFMLPLPHRVETFLSLPLRHFATHASTYTLQTLGFAAVSEGNTIHVGDPPPLSVEDACSGLGMLVTFFAITTAVAMVGRRRLLDRVILVSSAVPIALIANVSRLTLTGILKVEIGSPTAGAFHNSLAAAIVMIVLALGLLWIESWLLARLLLEPELTPFHKSFLGKRPSHGPGTEAKLARTVG